ASELGECNAGPALAARRQHVVDHGRIAIRHDVTDQRTNVELAPANQVDHRGVIAAARPGPVRVARRNAGLVRANDGDLAAKEDVETEWDGGAGIRPGGSRP